MKSYKATMTDEDRNQVIYLCLVDNKDGDWTLTARCETKDGRTQCRRTVTPPEHLNFIGILFLAMTRLPEEMLVGPRGASDLDWRLNPTMREIQDRKS